MRKLIYAACAALLSVYSTSATAATVQCGVGSDVVSVTTSIVSICGDVGNGNPLNGLNDEPNTLGYDTLDTTSTNGVVPLTIGTGVSGGNFSFGPAAGYEAFAIGFQTTVNAPNPDFFVVYLAATVLSGSWQLGDTAALLTSAILYGKPSTNSEINPVPIPGALFLFGSVIAGFFGFERFRKRRKLTAA